VKKQTDETAGKQTNPDRKKFPTFDDHYAPRVKEL